MADIKDTQTPKEECEAQNPEQCRVHGADYIQTAIAQMLAAEGVKGDIAVEKDGGKPHSFKVTFSGGGDSSAKAKDLITLFLGSRGCSDFETLKVGTLLKFNFTLPKDSDAGSKDKFGAESDFADKAKKEAAKKDGGEDYAPPSDAELETLARNYAQSFCYAGSNERKYRLAYGIWDRQSDELKSTKYMERIMPAMKDALAALPPKTFEPIAKAGRNFDAEYRSIPEIGNACFNAAQKHLDDMIIAAADEGRAFPSVPKANSLTDEECEEAAREIFPHIAKGQKSLLSQCKEYCGLTPAKGGNDLAYNAVLAAVRQYPDDGFDEDTKKVSVWQRSFIKDKAGNFIRFSPAAVQFAAQKIRDDAEAAARKLAQDTADKARMASVKGDADGREAFRKELCKRIKDSIPAALSEDARSAFDNAPFEIVRAVERTGVKFRVLNANSRTGDCTLGNNTIRIGKKPWTNNAMTVTHECGHSVLHAMQRAGATLDEARFQDIVKTAADETKAFADSVLGEGWENDPVWRNHGRTRGRRDNFAFRLLTSLYGYDENDPPTSQTELEEAHRKYRYALSLTDAMCAATGGKHFHGHTRNYYEDVTGNHDIHEIVADFTTLIVAGDKTALGAFPKTAAKVAETIYGMKDFKASAE